MCQRWDVGEIEGPCDQQTGEKLREVMVRTGALEPLRGQIGREIRCGVEVTLALRPLAQGSRQRFLEVESVGLGEHQTGDGSLGAPAAVVSSGYDIEVTSPQRWDP